MREERNQPQIAPLGSTTIAIQDAEPLLAVVHWSMCTMANRTNHTERSWVRLRLALVLVALGLVAQFLINSGHLDKTPRFRTDRSVMLS